jgi:perosamine synthetase
MFREIIDFVKKLYSEDETIPLHAPIFQGNEKKYLAECIESTFVSSVGPYVTAFEKKICEYTGAKYAIATTNGTAALHVALLLAGVGQDSEVLSQALTFVATANAITYAGAVPVFIDSGKDNLGMSAESLQQFLSENVENKRGLSINKKTGKRISACVPMHVFGHPVELNKIQMICRDYNIPLIEDAAEALGSFYDGQHVGLKGMLGVLSFNGNKIVTCGGGGMILTNDEALAKRALHLTTTAKVPHPWSFSHDEVGYNYRLPNINAALGLAQLENLEVFLVNKRKTAEKYRDFFAKRDLRFLDEPRNSKSNFWLNAVQFENRIVRDQFLEEANRNGIKARPIWDLMVDLPAFQKCQTMELKNARHYFDTVVNLPSSVRRDS